VQGVATTPFGAADAAVSATGTLIYVSGTVGGNNELTIAAMDRRGAVSPLPSIPSGPYLNVRLSPDATRLAIATSDDVWAYDLSRATLSRLTTDPAPDSRPLWTPDGQRIVYSSWRAGYPEIFWRRADGSGREERLLAGSKDLVDFRAEAWSPDGKQMLIEEISPGATRCAIAETPIDRPSEVKVLVKNEFCNDWPSISPDGRWIVYSSSLSGRQEVYVERYPELGNRQQISTSGGGRPLWSRDGHELFFLGLDYKQLFAVPVQSGATLLAGVPRPLLDANLIRNGGDRPYDVARDGRFFVIRGAQSDSGNNAASMVLVLNWAEELKRLVPTK
jgi:dipeptidyl aminopeptidase/acylaminoacyl peptidase